MIKIRTIGDQIIISGIPREGSYPASTLTIYEENGLVSVLNTLTGKYLLKGVRAEQLEDEAGQPFVEAGKTLNEAVEDKVNSVKKPRVKSYVFFEENNTLSDNALEWSQGANQEGLDFVCVDAGHFSGMSIRMLNAPTQSSCIVGIEINGVNRGSITLPVRQNQAVVTFPTPIPYQAGDLVQIRTLIAGKARKGRILLVATE